MKINGRIISDAADILGLMKLSEEDKKEIQKDFREVDIENCIINVSNGVLKYSFGNGRNTYRMDEVNRAKRIIDELSTLDKVYCKKEGDFPLILTFQTNKEHNCCMIAPIIKDEIEEERRL